MCWPGRLTQPVHRRVLLAYTPAFCLRSASPRRLTFTPFEFQADTRVELVTADGTARRVDFRHRLAANGIVSGGHKGSGRDRWGSRPAVAQRPSTSSSTPIAAGRAATGTDTWDQGGAGAGGGHRLRAQAHPQLENRPSWYSWVGRQPAWAPASRECRRSSSTARSATCARSRRERAARDQAAWYAFVGWRLLFRLRTGSPCRNRAQRVRSRSLLHGADDVVSDPLSSTTGGSCMTRSGPREIWIVQARRTRRVRGGPSLYVERWPVLRAAPRLDVSSHLRLVEEEEVSSATAKSRGLATVIGNNDRLKPKGEAMTVARLDSSSIAATIASLMLLPSAGNPRRHLHPSSRDGALHIARSARRTPASPTPSARSRRRTSNAIPAGTRSSISSDRSTGALNSDLALRRPRDVALGMSICRRPGRGRRASGGTGEFARFTARAVVTAIQRGSSALGRDVQLGHE